MRCTERGVTSGQRQAEVGGGDRAGMGRGEGWESGGEGRLTADVVRGMEEKNGLFSDKVSTAGAIAASFPFLENFFIYWSLGYKGPVAKYNNLLCPTVGGGDFEAKGPTITCAPSSSLFSPALLRPRPCSRPPPHCPSLSSSPSLDFIWRRRRSSRGGATACRGCA